MLSRNENYFMLQQLLKLLFFVEKLINQVVIHDQNERT